MKRSGEPPMCQMEKGCAKGTIDRQHVLSPRNARIVAHYRECRGSMSFPLDGIVRHNAAIISEVERMLDRVEQQKSANAITALAIRGVV